MKKILKLFTPLIPLASLTSIMPIAACSKPKVPYEDKCLGVSVQEKCLMTFAVDIWDPSFPYYKPNLEISTNKGKSWTQCQLTKTLIGYEYSFTIPANSQILLRGNNPNGFSSNTINYSHFSFIRK